MTLRTVFLGTAPFGFPVMEGLAHHGEVDLRGVITQPDRQRGRGQEDQSPPVAEYARELDLPLYQPEDVNEDGLDCLDELAPLDMGIVIAYGQILSEDVIERPDRGFFNFHASLLPRWRGAAPIRHTLTAGDEETGVSVFRIEPELDAGPVCVRLRTDVRSRETYGSLYERLSQLNVGALRMLLSDLEADRLRCRPQEGEVTHASKITTDDAAIDWTESAESLERHVRAYNPDPGAHTHLDGERFKIYDARIVEEPADGAGPGEVVARSSETLKVATGDGVLELISVQPAGSRQMDVESFLAGRPDLTEGDRFTTNN